MMKCEVLIVGAGPAGATCSMFLSKAGIPHVMVDADAFPRDKICGDGLDMKVFRVLNQHSPDTLQALWEHPELETTFGLRLTLPNGKQENWIHKPQGETSHPINGVMKRLHFDAFLHRQLDANYVDFRPNTKVTAITRDGDAGWVVQTTAGEFRTKYLIGADGDHSVVLRSIGQRTINRRHYSAALRQYWRGIEGFHPERLLEVYVVPNKPMAYFWIFPLPNGEANVGYGMVSELVSRTNEKLHDSLHHIVHEDPTFRERFANATPLEKPRGYGLPVASNPDRQNAGPGYLLVGDAASNINPANGEGIGSGMISGIVAAEYIRIALETKSEAHFSHYNAELTRRLRDEIKTYNLMMNYQLWRIQDWFMPIVPKLYDFQKRLDVHAPKWIETIYKRPVECQF